MLGRLSIIAGAAIVAACASGVEVSDSREPEVSEDDRAADIADEQPVETAQAAGDAQARVAASNETADPESEPQLPQMPAERPNYVDADIERLLVAEPVLFERIHVLETKETFDGQEVGMSIFESRTRPDGPFYFVMHDEEDEAFDAMVWGIANFGGTGIAIENDETRNLAGGIDINNQFGRADRPELNAYFRDRIEASGTVIALHNNYNHPAGSMYYGNPAYFTASCPGYESADIDDVIIMGSIGGSAGTFCASNEVQRYTGDGSNVGWATYQDRTDSEFDCDRRCNFQKFAISYLGARYYNLEAEHNRGAVVQKRQVCLVTGKAEQAVCPKPEEAPLAAAE